MAKYPLVSFFSGDMLADTGHLSPAEFGAYMRLLLTMSRRPKGDLPNDDTFLGRIIGDTRNWHRLRRNVLANFNVGDDGMFRHEVIERERNYVSQRAETNRRNGSARWQKNKDLDDATAMQSDMQNRCATNAPTPEPTPTPTATEGSSNFRTDAARERTGGWDKWPSDLNGNGNGKRSYRERVTIKDPDERIDRFAKWLADICRVPWLTIASAMDSTDKDHAHSLAKCQKAARDNGKGWPCAWPTNRNYSGKSGQ